MFKVLSRIRFSLRTLLIVVLLIGALMTVKWRWEPWAKLATIDFNASWPNKAEFDQAGSLYAARTGGTIARYSSTGMRMNTIVDGIVEADAPATWPIYELLLSPDGRRLIFSSGRTFYLYDTVMGRQLAVLATDEHRCISAALSHDGKTAAVATAGRIELFECESGKSLLTCPIECDLAWFTPDDECVNGIDWPGNLWQWDWRTKKAPVSNRRVGNASRTDLSPDSRWIVSATYDYRPSAVNSYLTLLDATSGLKVQSLTCSGASLPLTAFAGSILIVASGRGDISRIDLAKKTNEPIATLYGVRAIALRPDGQEYATSNTQVVIVSDVNGSNPLTLPDSGGVQNLHYSPDGNTLLLGSQHLTLYQRRRPNYAWSVYAMPELWLSALLAIALLVSIYRDYRPRPRAAVLTPGP